MRRECAKKREREKTQLNIQNAVDLHKVRVHNVLLRGTKLLVVRVELVHAVLASFLLHKLGL